MRVNRYTETDITQAYVNQKRYDYHRHKLDRIQTQVRNPFRNTQKEMNMRELSWSPKREDQNYTASNKSSLLKSNFREVEQTNREELTKESILEQSERDERTDMSDVTNNRTPDPIRREY